MHMIMGNPEQLLLQGQYDEGQLAQALLDHYYAPLHYLAYSLLDDAEEAEDIVQETLLVALGKVDQYQPGTDLKAWLSRIAIYRCRDVMRWRKVREKWYAVWSRVAMLGAPPHSPEKRTSDRELQGELWQAVDNLGAKHRTPSSARTAVYLQSAQRHYRRSQIMKPIYAVGGIAAVVILALAGWFIMRPNLETNSLDPETADQAVAAQMTETAELPAIVVPTETAVPPTAEPPPATAAPTEEPTPLPPTDEPAATATPSPPTKIPEPIPDMALWSRHAGIPVGRYDHAASVVDGIIYVFGGFGSPQRVDAYDPLTNNWTQKADMPTARAGLATSVVDGKIYAIGGNPGSAAWEPPLAAVEMYDPATDSWTRKADMPTARDYLSTSVVDGKIYAIGGAVTTGFEKYSSLRTVEEYDPAANSWTTKSELNRGRDAISTNVIDGKIYALGGWAPYDEMYDPQTDTWTKLSVAPVTVASPADGLVDGKIYLLGGVAEWAEPGAFDAQVYDPQTDTWSTLDPMPFNGAFFASAVVDGQVYIIGGTYSDYPVYPPHLDTVWSYTPEK